MSVSLVGRATSSAHALLLKYDAALHHYTIPVKCATSGCVNFAADACFQLGTLDHWDPARSAAVGVFYGACWYAPFMHVVTTTWGRVLPSTAVPSLMLKSGVDVSTSFVVNLCGAASNDGIDSRAKTSVKTTRRRSRRRR